MTLYLAGLAALLSGSLVALYLQVSRSDMAPLVEPSSAPLDRREQIGRQLAGSKGWDIRKDVKADLWLAAKGPDRFRYERLLSVVALTGVGLVLGLISGGPFLTVFLTGGSCYIGWILPRRILASEVNVKRQQLLAALAFWAELIAASVGGSKAVGSAAKAAAERGEGWAWDLFRDACSRADTTPDTLPVLLRQTAANGGLAELSGFAESIEAASERGAVVREAMDEQAATLRGKVHEQQRQFANDRSNIMIVPVGLIFGGFMAFLFFIVIESLTIAF